MLDFDASKAATLMLVFSVTRWRHCARHPQVMKREGGS
jgi:hypothetical protein